MELVGESGWVPHALQRFNLFDRLWLALHALQFRREATDRWLLAAFFLTMKRNRPAV